MPPKRTPDNKTKGKNNANANKHYDADPSFEQVIQLALECGYKEYRPTISATLYFVEAKPTPGMKPIKINVYPTTRSIMTYLDHPKAGVNALWRSNAYDDLAELRELFMNPRAHTDKGYRNKGKAVRGCVQCGEMKARTEYTNNQWSKGPDVNRCRSCIEAGPAAASVAAPEATNMQGDATPTVVIEGLEELGLSDDGNVSLRDDMERRQFNCPECPQNGRGEFVFFKKVPVHKPIVKCPQCKRANNGNCKRLHPVPKEEERGYGLYKCSICNDKWGSQRGVANMGQECGKCLNEGRPNVFVKPFRLGPIYNGRGGGRGGGGRGGGGRGRGGGRGPRRVPRETISEENEVQPVYTPSDRQRSDNFAQNNSYVPTPDQTRSYDFQPVEAPSTPAVPPGLAPVENAPPPATAPVQPNSRVHKGYHHKCEGCAKGLCRRRRMPKSKVHVVSDGDTVSTRGSIKTNSEVDKSEFEDRDFGFGFDDEIVFRR
eukprot:Nitzschia sp. Nitz4//scaffold187_size43274//27258//28847//NITZ4_007338-RA/size43274-snap-gene-0.56-mRNA-1//1//CDS//3329539822//7724//frame0